MYGYPIKAVTYDGVFSTESIQQWRKQGMKTGHVSVDKTSVPYKQLRDTFNDNRLRMYHQDVLISELFELEYDETKDKIDHPPNGSKDVADAVCGAYHSMLQRRASWVAAQMDDDKIAKSNRAEFDGRYEVGDRN
jgi:phage terminase large subunit-like protein